MLPHAQIRVCLLPGRHLPTAPQGLQKPHLAGNEEGAPGLPDNDGTVVGGDLGGDEDEEQDPDKGPGKMVVSWHPPLLCFRVHSPSTTHGGRGTPWR